MRNEIRARIAGYRVILMDSISLIEASDAGAIIITGSHGGAISAAFAARHPPCLVVFNDAGGGKAGAGTAALSLLDARGIASAATSHMSARIGDAEDAWTNGVISAAGTVAQAAGLRVGRSVRQSAEVITREEPRGH